MGLLGSGEVPATSETGATAPGVAVTQADYAWYHARERRREGAHSGEMSMKGGEMQGPNEHRETQQADHE